METVTEGEHAKPEAAPSKPEEEQSAAGAQLPPVLYPEVEIYLRLVTTVALLDNKLYQEVRSIPLGSLAHRPC